MHTNYYFLRQLAPALKSLLVTSSESLGEPDAGLRFMECFSQDRDEVIMVFAQAKGKNNYYKPFYIKASLRPDFSGLVFPETLHRARTNSINLLEVAVGEPGYERRVVDVRSFLNERCLAVVLEGGFSLLFKFFGNRPNLLVFQNNNVVDLFNRQLTGDEHLLLDGFDRPINQSFEAFEQAGFDQRTLFPTFGRVVNEWIEQQKAVNGIEKWAIIENALHQLEHPHYYLTQLHHKPTLSLLPLGDIQREYRSPVEATIGFYVAYTGLSLFEQEKAALLRLFDKNQKRLDNQLNASVNRQLLREEAASHEEMGHILMANLHDIPQVPGAKSPERLTLYDFYRDQPITLKLKPDLSPQKNAENFYRKAKNEKIEEQYLADLIESRERELQQIKQQRDELESLKTLKELRRFSKQIPLTGTVKNTIDSGPLFKEVVIDGFRVLIGKNAKNNDLLTQKYAFKDDLWLHARDVTGSHVLLKYQAGKPFPKPVIERAAELAAWHSKRRTDSLCPVTVTPKKFVRKPKGMAPGQVIIEKEDVVLVVPRGE